MSEERHTCRTCGNCQVFHFLIQDDSYWCTLKSKKMYHGKYGPGYRRGDGIIYLDYEHKWDCWRDPSEPFKMEERKFSEEMLRKLEGRE